MKTRVPLLAVTLATGLACSGKLTLDSVLEPPVQVSVSTRVRGAHLAWQPVASASSYRVYVGNEPGVSPQFNQRSIDVAAPLVSVTNLLPGNTYYFAVASIRGADPPALSGELSTTALDLGVLTSVPSWNVEGAPGDAFASALASADVTLDGRTDLLAGAPGAAGGLGEARLFLGSASALALAPAFTATGPVNASGDPNGFARTLGITPDFSGDGYPELMLPAFDSDPIDSGRLFLYYGANDGARSPVGNFVFAFDTALELARAVAAPGDLDGDGYADLVVGAPSLGSSDHGGFAEAFQAIPAGIYSSPMWLATGGGIGGGFGFALATGDVDGDGRPDVAVSAPFAAGGAGAIQLFLGTGGGLGFSTTPVFTFTGNPGEQLGTTLAFADVDGDGHADLLAGAPLDDQGRGRVLIFRGNGNGLQNPLVVHGSSTGEHFSVIANLGDLNGDGRDDIAIGAPSFAGLFVDEGRVDVYLGSGTALDAQPIFSESGRQTGALYGSSVAAGDFDADGSRDLVVGAPGFDGGRGLGVLYPGFPPSGPDPNAGYPFAGTAGATLSPVLASFSDPSRRSHACTWDWGDGTQSTIAPCTAAGAGGASHRWTSAGSFVVKLTVTRDGDQVSGQSITRATITSN